MWFHVNDFVNMAQWSSSMIRASGGLARHNAVAEMYVTRVQFPVEPNFFFGSTRLHTYKGSNLWALWDGKTHQLLDLVRAIISESKAKLFDSHH